MKRLVKALNAAFGLWNTGRFQFNTQLFASVSELGIGILVQRRGAFLFIGKNSPLVCEELKRDAIIGENLVKHMVIAVQGFLCIEEAPLKSGSLFERVSFMLFHKLMFHQAIQVFLLG